MTCTPTAAADAHKVSSRGCGCVRVIDVSAGRIHQFEKFMGRLGGGCLSARSGGRAGWALRLVVVYYADDVAMDADVKKLRAALSAAQSAASFPSTFAFDVLPQLGVCAACARARAGSTTHWHA